MSGALGSAISVLFSVSGSHRLDAGGSMSHSLLIFDIVQISRQLIYIGYRGLDRIIGAARIFFRRGPGAIQWRAADCHTLAVGGQLW